jgi:integrase
MDFCPQTYYFLDSVILFSYRLNILFETKAYLIYVCFIFVDIILMFSPGEKGMTSKLRLTFGVRQSEAIEWAEKDESAKRFLSRYKNRSRNEYTRVLALFFNWLKIKKEIALSPTEFLNSQLRKSHSDKTQERRWGANLALEFVRDGEFSDASDTHRRLHWNVIKQFFDFNEVPFCSARNPLGGKSGRRKYKPKPLTREDAKRILGALNQRDCAVAIIML